MDLVSSAVLQANTLLQTFEGALRTAQKDVASQAQEAMGARARNLRDVEGRVLRCMERELAVERREAGQERREREGAKRGFFKSFPYPPKLYFAITQPPVVRFEHVRSLSDSTQSQESKSEVGSRNRTRQCALGPILRPPLYLWCLRS